MGERPTPDAPHPGRRRLPRAPSCRPPQHARECAVGLVTGPHARMHPHPQQVDSGSRQPAQRAGSRGWESARPRTPHTQAGGAPPRAPSCRPHSAQSKHARARAVGLVTGPHARIPRIHSQWVVGPGSPPKGRAVGPGRAPDPGRPTPRQEAFLRAPSCRPNSAQSQLARARAVGLVTGPHARIPPHPQPVGSGPRQLLRRRAVGDGRAPDPGRPTPRQEAPPPGHPRAAPTARKKVRCGVGDGSPRPHPPAPTASG